MFDSPELVKARKDQRKDLEHMLAEEQNKTTPNPAIIARLEEALK